MIRVAASIENDCFNAVFQCPLGKKFPYFSRGVYVTPGDCLP